MKQMMTRIIFSIVLLVSCYKLAAQGNMAQNAEVNMFQTMAVSEFDLLIRIHQDMNEEEIKTRIDVLQSFDKNIKIDYLRDESGNIKELSGSGGENRGSCKSDDFGFVIIALKNNHWQGCMMSDKK